MTLIFAGHNLSFDDGDTKSIGLFVTADSAITSINSESSKCTHILSGFQKVYPLHINVYEPSFNQDYDGGYFAGYSSIHFQQTGFIAIAGGTLVLQHVMNLINSHMQNLRISKDGAEYRIIRACEENSLIKNQGLTHYPNDTFTDHDYIGLNDAETYFKHIEYSISSSIKSAKPRQITNPSDVIRVGFEIVVGLYCEVNNQYILKTYTCEPKMIEAGNWDFDLAIKNISKNEIAVLGLKEYEETAIELLGNLVAGEGVISDSYFDLLNSCIDENNAENNKYFRFAISKPSVLYELEQNQFTKIMIHNGITKSVLHNRVNKRKIEWGRLADLLSPRGTIPLSTDLVK